MYVALISTAFKHIVIESTEKITVLKKIVVFNHPPSSDAASPENLHKYLHKRCIAGN